MASCLIPWGMKLLQKGAYSEWKEFDLSNESSLKGKNFLFKEQILSLKVGSFLEGGF